MKYFNTLPQIYITDPGGNYLLVTNLMARAELISSLLSNPLLFYQYDIQEHDTPESIANKYYGTVDRFWLVLFANQILDPQWGWPLTSAQFGDYITDKYAQYVYTYDPATVLAFVQSTIYGYTKTVTTTDGYTGLSTTNTYYLDQNGYNLLLTGTNTQYFPDGNSVTQTVTKQVLSLYDWENQLNESKRKINIINSQYVSSIESQFMSLMST